MSDIICRGKPLSYLEKELREEKFGCDKYGFAGGFSRSEWACNLHANMMEVNNDMKDSRRRADDPAAEYMVLAKFAEREYGDRMRDVQYDKAWLKAHPNVLDMVVGADYLAHLDTLGLSREEALEKKAWGALAFPEEREVYFLQCPIRPFRDEKHEPLGLLMVSVTASDVKGIPPAVYATLPQTFREEVWGVTDADLERYIERNVKPRIEGLTSVMNEVIVLKCGEPWAEGKEEDGSMKCVKHRTYDVGKRRDPPN